MGRFKTIQYAIDGETGLVWSRVDGEVAVPRLDFGGMSANNGYQTSYFLEKMSVFETVSNSLKWTKRIPVEIKNYHRAFWGMKAL